MRGRSLSVVPGVDFAVQQTAHGTMDGGPTREAGPAERGSVSIEVAVLAPAFIALMVLAGVAGRSAVAAEAIDAAAHDAARAASISRSAGRRPQGGAERGPPAAGLARVACANAPTADVHRLGRRQTHELRRRLPQPGRAGRHGHRAGRLPVSFRDISLDVLPGMPTETGSRPASPLPWTATGAGDERLDAPAALSGDHGRVSIFLAVTMIGVLAIIGLSFDGAGQLRTLQRADNLAPRRPARVGRPSTGPPPSRAGRNGSTGGRPASAVANYLSAAGATGHTVSFPTVAGETVDPGTRHDHLPPFDARAVRLRRHGHRHRRGDRTGPHRSTVGRKAAMSASGRSVVRRTGRILTGVGALVVLVRSGGRRAGRAARLRRQPATRPPAHPRRGWHAR